MMKNRIARLTTVAFSLFALALSYGVCMNAQDAKAKPNRSAKNKAPRSVGKKGKQGMARSRFRVKIDRSGDLQKYKASGKELVENINKGITPENEKAAYRALLMYVNKAGMGKFKGKVEKTTDEYYKAAAETLSGVAGKFTNKKITTRLAKLQTELNDPKARALKAEKKAKWRSEFKAKRSAKKAQKPGAKQARKS